VDDKIVVENINVPGSNNNVNKVKYLAMRKVLLSVVLKNNIGITQKQMLDLIQPYLPQDLWPSDAKSGWWMKTVQLDLEAKNIIRGNPTKPLTWCQM